MNIDFEALPEGLYLDIIEIVDINAGIAAEHHAIAVSDRADAEAKLPSILAEHFAGKAYEARLHWHYLDKPCVVEVLPAPTAP